MTRRDVLSLLGAAAVLPAAILEPSSVTAIPAAEGPAPAIAGPVPKLTRVPWEIPYVFRIGRGQSITMQHPFKVASIDAPEGVCLSIGPGMLYVCTDPQPAAGFPAITVRAGQAITNEGPAAELTLYGSVILEPIILIEQIAAGGSCTIGQLSQCPDDEDDEDEPAE